MKINYSLINLTFLSIIIFLFIQTIDTWLKVVHFIYNICLPFFVSFALSYVFYPTVLFFRRYFNKTISTLIVFFLFLFFIVLFLYLIIPILISQAFPALEQIICFIKEISLKYNVNLDKISSLFLNIYEEFSKQINTKEIVKSSLNFVWFSLITISSFFYILLDMEKLKNLFSKNLFLKGLHVEMTNYLLSFRNVIVITFFEYFFAFFLISHPNYLLLAFVASVSNLIPFFGAFLTLLLAVITSLSSDILIKTLIVCLILNVIDNYVINPVFYGKKNNLHPVLIFISLSLGTKIFGALGPFISIPLTIIIIYSFKYLKKIILSVKNN